MNNWLIKDIECFKNLGFKIDICDINGVDINNFLSRFEWADVLYFEGGNTQWLRKSIKSSGLEEYLSKLLETRVWIGASAGSCVLCTTICNLLDENIKDFQFVPHFNSEYFPKIRKEMQVKI